MQMPDEGGNSNFASTFAMWDLLFVTFYMPPGRLPARYGVDDPQFIPAGGVGEDEPPGIGSNRPPDDFTNLQEVFPGLKLNNILDVSFQGFIKVVDALGCAYVTVDHRYYNPLGTGYTAINLQPGYQKLCYEDALSYVRYRHTDSDFVRVARQQDFMRALR